MAIRIKGTSALEFAAVAAQLRAAQYRAKVGQLRRMAEGESIGRLRDNLLKLADQYEALAGTTELSRPEGDERKLVRRTGLPAIRGH
jgi:hypothetical protein